METLLTDIVFVALVLAGYVFAYRRGYRTGYNISQRQSLEDGITEGIKIGERGTRRIVNQQIALHLHDAATGIEWQGNKSLSEYLRTMN